MATTATTASLPAEQGCGASRRSWLALAGAGIVGLALAGCAMTPEERQISGQASVAGPLAISKDRLVGRWGIASYHDEKDRARTEAQARAQCSQPYVITPGPTNGVMMHVADDPKLYELALKRGADGKTYIGFDAPPGHPQDREILSATDNVLVMRFVDPDAHRRYGTFIFVRCGA